MRSIRAGAACLLACLLMQPASAQESGSSNFYAGRQVEVLVGSSPGDGYDAYTRLLARHIGRHLPGNPSMVVKNMPGGGGRPALRHIDSVMVKDGSAFGAVLRSILFDSLYGQGVNVDPQNLSWIGSLNSEVSLCLVWHGTGVRSLNDARSRELQMGSTGPTVSDSAHARMLNAIGKTQLKIVLGYASSPAIHLALENGEVDGRCGVGWDTILSRHPRWMPENKIVLLAQFGLTKHPALPNVPWIVDLAQTDEMKQMANLVVAPNEMGRPFLGPPGMPEDKLRLLRRAFDATAKDPLFLEDAKKLDLEIRPLTGEVVEAIVKRSYATPKPIVELAKTILDPG